MVLSAVSALHKGGEAGGRKTSIERNRKTTQGYIYRYVCAGGRYPKAFLLS